MSLLDQIQDIVGKGLTGFGMSGQAQSPQGQQGQENNGPLGALSALLGPAALGGLAGALLTSRAARGIAGGALLAGTGAALWNKYIGRMRQAEGQGADGSSFVNSSAAPIDGNSNSAQATLPVFSAESSTEERAARLVRAFVFAAKSDGHIDEKEQKAIYDNLQRLNIGSDAQALVQKAINEPLDPALIADGVKNEQEALEIYALSCSVLDVDHFMERSYLDALAKALHIPDDVKSDLEKQVHGQQGSVA